MLNACQVCFVECVYKIKSIDQCLRWGRETMVRIFYVSVWGYYNVNWTDIFKFTFDEFSWHNVN